MLFIKTEDLKVGTRLARPIYSKTGVLLFDRNSLLTAQAIDSVRNFGLLGIYALEPAEPLPPMSEEDLEFERFQTMTVNSIQEEMNKIITTKSQGRSQMIANNIIKNYGYLDSKINFYQNLRSRDDYVFRHSLNVAILCTMITRIMNIRLEEQMQIICAALVHDIGKLNYASESIYGDVTDAEELQRLFHAQQKGGELIEQAFASNGVAIRRICMQALRMQMGFLTDERINNNNMKMVTGAKILLVANRYDEITAMNLQGTAQSEVKAIKEFLDNPEIYEPEVVSALIRSVNILFPGVSIELSTGEKAMVLVENKSNILRPTVLSYRDNSIIDLSLAINEDIEVVDIMKTLDNRYIMDNETLAKAGYIKADASANE